METFLQKYLVESHRRILFVAGAGFDPRSTLAAGLVSGFAAGQVRGFFLREERHSPMPELVERADGHEGELRALTPESGVAHVDVFAPDNAIVGGRTAATLVNQLPLEGLSDVFVHLSVHSVGVAFPVVRHLSAAALKHGHNLHLVVTDELATDSGIESIPSDLADTVHGFEGG